MSELRLVQGSPEWHKLRKRALSDLMFFSDAVLGYGNLIPLTIPTHRLMLKFAERATGSPLLDQAHFRLVSVPRGVGKTSGITISKVIQDSCRDPDGSTMLANENQENANAFLSEIAGHFENNTFLRALFPDVIPAEPHQQDRWSAEALNLTRTTNRKEPTVFTVGVGGTKTGMHPDRIVVDDCISREAMENARVGSWQIMEKTNRWINQLRPLLNYSAPWWEILFLGTRWWQGDSYEHIERAFGYGEPKQFVRLKQPLPDGSTQVLEGVYRVGDLAIFRRPIIEHGACIFPEKYSMDDLAKIRLIDPELYAANFLNEPATDLTAQFKQGWLRYYHWSSADVLRCLAPDGTDRTVHQSDLDTLISVDPAFSEGPDTKSRQALVVTGSDEGGLHFLLMGQATKQSVDAFIGDIVEAVKRYRPRKLLIERAGQQLAFIMLVKERLAASDLHVPVEEVSPGGKKKEMRIQTLEPYFQRGTFYVEKSQMDFLNEYATFPRGENKDVLDALAYQAPFWRTGIQTKGTPQQSQRAQSELAAYYAKMGREAPRMIFGKDPTKYRQDGSARH